MSLALVPSYNLVIIIKLSDNAGHGHFAEIDNVDDENGNTVEKRWIMQMSELRKWQSLWQSPNPKLSSSFACPHCHGRPLCKGKDIKKFLKEVHLMLAANLVSDDIYHATLVDSL